MLLGMIRPTNGTAKLLNQSITDVHRSSEARKRIAFVSENKQLYSYMSVSELIRFTKSFYPSWSQALEKELLGLFRLPLDRKIGSLSKGMRTKLCLLLAFARKPELVILDEPSDGLDPIGIEQLLECVVARRNEGTSVFFSSHQIPEVERIAEQICILHRGRLSVDVPLSEIQQHYRIIKLPDTSSINEIDLRNHGVCSIRRANGELILLANNDAENAMSYFRDIHIFTAKVMHSGLREAFLEIAQEDEHALV
jgi:ABC-2 type transport system ATP-binding protein